jgi:hypothetical protein|tara:strand:+ start:99 stop:230 length:132 start_codon:yes stop_codon:yes gene_type:complete
LDAVKNFVPPLASDGVDDDPLYDALNVDIVPEDVNNKSSENND